MADIQYLNYGNLQIELLAFLNKAANEVQSYVQNLPWSNKRKLKFMSAYSDIMNRGLLGASNNTGQWMINVNGVIDLDSMSKKDREMYLEAAYFIQLQMSGIPVRKDPESETKKEEDKSDLPVFDFNTDFIKHVNNSINGGQPLNIGYGDLDLWNYLDKRDATGKRGRTERAKKLAELLTSYQKKLGDGSLYNFEGSPYENINDFNTKINKAIAALNTPDVEDDRGALLAIGLNQADWFNNGLGDPSGMVDSEGNPLSFAQLNKYTEAQTKVKQLEDVKLAEQNRLYFTRGNSKLNGKNPVELKKKYKNLVNLINALNNYSQYGYYSLTGEEMSELLGAYRYLAKAPIDLKTFDLLRNSPLFKDYKNEKNISRFKKINGVDGYIYDTVTNQVILIHNKDEFDTVKNLFQQLDLLAGISTLDNKDAISKVGWTTADKLDMVSIIGDLVSLGGFWANIGGTAVSLTSDIFSDISRGKDLESILKNVFVNAGWGLAGLLPGAKSTKLIARTSRVIPKAIMSLQSLGIMLDPEIQNSAMKFTSFDGLKTASSKDLENLKYLFHAATGGINIARSHYRAKSYREKLNKQKIKTENGGEKYLSNKNVKEINKVGRQKGLKAAEDLFKEKTGEQIAENLFKFSESGRSRFNPVRYNIINKLAGTDLRLKGEKVTDSEAMSEILQRDKELPWYNLNKGYATFELTPFRNTPPLRLQKKQLTLSNEPLVLPNGQQLVQLNGRQQVQEQALVQEILPAEVRKQYREILSNNFSNTPLTSGDYVFNGNNLRIVRLQDNTFSLFRNGEFVTNEINQIELKKAIRDIIKQSRKTVDNSGKVTKISINEMGKILKDLKAKGWLKYGGRIDKLKIQICKKYIKK